MPRLNIFVPDDLHENLEKIRDTLNVSAICQDALRREMARRQPLTGDIEVTEEIVERLRSEKEDYERESRDRGFRMGIEWARRAKFSGLRRWGDYKPGSPERLANLDTPPYETVKWLYELGENVGGTRSLEQLLQSNTELKHAKVVWDYPNDPVQLFWFEFGDKTCFNQGFLQAVKRFWEQVEARL